MTKHRLRQLKHYSSLSASFLFLTNTANTQIIYHDIDPDGVAYLDEYFLDLDGDDIADFKVIFTVDPFPGFLPDATKIRINPLGSNEVAYAIQTMPVTFSGTPSATLPSGATQLYFSVAPVFNEGDTIDAGLNFHSDIARLYDRVFFYVHSSLNYETFLPGYWMGETDKFAGIRFYFDGAFHYGWIRLSLNESGVTIHDYAYESTPDTPIQTQLVNYSTSWLFAQDAGITGTGADLQFSFTAAGDETDILAYRVICVKQGMVDELTLSAAALLSPDQYIEIIPDGSETYTTFFTGTSLDSEGDMITSDQPYRLLILNVMDPATGFENIISLTSESVLLTDTVDAAADVVLGDIADNGNGSDLQVNFTAPDNIQGIAEYRVMIVKRDSAETFDLLDAEAVTAGNYISVAPGLAENEIIFNVLSTDVDGDLIQPAKYQSFVLSMADGIVATQNLLSEPSLSVTVEIPTPPVSSILFEDVAEFGDGRDIRISFPHIIPEQTIDRYRIFIMNSADAFDFDLDAAFAVDPDNYITLAPTGNDIIIEGESGTTDINGALLSWGVPYFVYVVCIASQYGINDTLSAPSNELIINFPSTESVEDLNREGITVFSAGEQVHITFATVPDKSALFMLRDNAGRKVFESGINEQHTVFNVDLPAGTYLATVLSGDKLLSCPLFISK